MKKIIMMMAIALLCSAAYAQINMTAYQYWYDTASASRVTVPVTHSAQLNVSNASLAAGTLSVGTHALYIRTQDSSGSWSSVVYRNFEVPVAGPWLLTGIRYWTDTLTSQPTDMREIAFYPRQQVDTSLIVELCNSNTGGVKKVYYQLKDNRGNWSAVVWSLSPPVNTGPPAAFAITGSNTGDSITAPSYLGLQWYTADGAAVPGQVAGPLHGLVNGTTYYAVISDSCGQAFSTDSFKYINVNGIMEHNGMLATSIYPNPTSGHITIQLSELPAEVTSVTITDVLGSVVLTREITGLKTDCMISAPAGVYFATVKNSNGSDTQRVIVK